MDFFFGKIRSSMEFHGTREYGTWECTNLADMNSSMQFTIWCEMWKKVLLNISYIFNCLFGDWQQNKVIRNTKVKKIWIVFYIFWILKGLTLCRKYCVGTDWPLPHHNKTQIVRIFLNPLHAKFFRGNINIYLHFVSFFHIDMTQVLKIFPQLREGPTYSI